MNEGRRAAFGPGKSLLFAFLTLLLPITAITISVLAQPVPEKPVPSPILVVPEATAVAFASEPDEAVPTEPERPPLAEPTAVAAVAPGPTPQPQPVSLFPAWTRESRTNFIVLGIDRR